ncbi:hypothetical protein A2U01_0078614 [Trifolium medium]|uniref:Uncharacterized protein n=1 Tax=Trifolium medium TaxID=97028 RepID=A0A392T8B4_9FABA|nr:hypothetical protein [Trifolium medium]
MRSGDVQSEPSQQYDLDRMIQILNLTAPIMTALNSHVTTAFPNSLF